jgi:ATP-binding cassette subfamily F protein 3
MSIVRLESVVREVGDFTILDRVDSAIAARDRIGLVGPNGAGKTTLLRLIAGLDEPDRGAIHRKRGLTISMLVQEAHVDATFMAAPSLRHAVRAGATRLEELEATLRRFEAENRVTEPEYEAVQHEFMARDGYSLDQRVEAALSGLGFERDQWDRPPVDMSGGEQTRAALARLLLADPDLLLLDEPTNHLDLAALEWLEEVLPRRHGTLLVASHDRAFLDATVERIWEMRDRRLTPFRGGYSAYARQREERDLRAAQEAHDRAAEIGREKALVEIYRHQRKHAKMHEHESRLAALEPVDRRHADARLRLPTESLAGGSAARSYESVIRAENLVIGYGSGGAGTPRSGAVRLGPDRSGAPELKPVHVARVPWLELRRGDRVGVVGPNGAGKSTLLRTIAGQLAPLDGALDLGRNVQLGYLAQLREAPIPGATVLDAILDELPIAQGEARSHLARFLFRGDDVLKEVSALSGGERSRLELALLFLLPANLLLLDEPTNHLDIPAREALEAFMAGTDATLLIVSHDRRLLETACESLWVVDDGLAVAFEGGYHAWRSAAADGWTTKMAAEQEALRLRDGRASQPDPRQPGLVVGKSGRSAGARSRGRAAPSQERAFVGTAIEATSATTAGTAATTRSSVKLSKDAYRRRKAQVDQELGRLGIRRSELEAALVDPGVHGNFLELRRVTGELATVNEALAAAEEAWLQLEESAP